MKRELCTNNCACDVKRKGQSEFYFESTKGRSHLDCGVLESLRMGVDVEVDFNKRDMRVWIGELHKRGSYGQSTEFLVVEKEWSRPNLARIVVFAATYVLVLFMKPCRLGEYLLMICRNLILSPS